MQKRVENLVTLCHQHVHEGKKHAAVQCTVYTKRKNRSAIAGSAVLHVDCLQKTEETM